MDAVKRENDEKTLTPLEAFEPLLDLLLVLLPLLDLLELHLLAELLALALLALFLAALDRCALVKQPLAYTFHVRVRLDHLREVVRGPGERQRVLLCEGARGGGAVQGLFVAML